MTVTQQALNQSKQTSRHSAGERRERSRKVDRRIRIKPVLQFTCISVVFPLPAIPMTIHTVGFLPAAGAAAGAAAAEAEEAAASTEADAADEAAEFAGAAAEGADAEAGTGAGADAAEAEVDMAECECGSEEVRWMRGAGCECGGGAVANADL